MFRFINGFLRIFAQIGLRSQQRTGSGAPQGLPIVETWEDAADRNEPAPPRNRSTTS